MVRPVSPLLHPRDFEIVLKRVRVETNPNDVARLANEKKANERMAVLNENRDWQHQSKGNYQPVIPAGRGGGTGRGGKQLGAMRGKGQGNGQGSTKTTQSKIQDFVSTSTSTTTTNPNAIDVKVKGKSREIVLGSSSEESEEEIDEIEESPDPPPTKSTRSRGLIPAATIKPRTKYVQVEEEEEGLESTEVKKRNSKGGIREGKVREMVGEIDAKAIDAQAVKERSAPHLAPLGGPDDSFDSILVRFPSQIYDSGTNDVVSMISRHQSPPNPLRNPPNIKQSPQSPSSTTDSAINLSLPNIKITPIP